MQYSVDLSKVASEFLVKDKRLKKVRPKACLKLSVIIKKVDLSSYLSDLSVSTAQICDFWNM